MIDATNSVLGQVPEPLDCVYVRIARDVNLGRVMNTLVLITHSFEWIVASPFIGKNRALGHRALDDMRHERSAGGARNDFRDDAAFALHHSEGESLASHASTLMLAFAGVFVFLQTAERTLIHFDLARKLGTVIFVQKRSDLLEHAPRAFVSNTDLPLKLLCRDAAFSRGHEVDCVEPEPQGCSRILKDSSLHRMLMMAAELTFVGWTICLAMMLSNFLTRGTKDAIWVKLLNQPFETSRVVGEFTLKVHQRKGAVGCA